MRFIVGWALCSLVAASAAKAQGTPPMNPLQASDLPEQVAAEQARGMPPPGNQATPLHKVTVMVKKRLDQAIDANPYADLSSWRPLSTREKFQLFLNHTYSPGTFAGTGVDAVKDTLMDHNPQYESGLRGLGQHYGVDLGTSETEVFLEKFLVPTVLKQDPRYFRSPGRPWMRRTFYAMSRVLLARTDSGHQTFNASRIVGGAISQSLADLYVPGNAQGLHPIADRVLFDLGRDAGFNLVHEFWPDVRRKFLHR